MADSKFDIYLIYLTFKGHQKHERQGIFLVNMDIIFKSEVSDDVGNNFGHNLMLYCSFNNFILAFNFNFFVYSRADM